MTCNTCQKQLHSKAVICTKCGSRTDNPVPNASYQPMAGFFLSIFMPFIGLIVSLVQLVKAIKRKGLWVFPMLGVIIGAALVIFGAIMAISYYSLIVELISL